MLEIKSNFEEINKQIKEIEKRFDTFDGAKDSIRKIVDRDLEQRKTVTPDISSVGDYNQQVGFTTEDKYRSKYWRPIYDYESSPENPFLRITGNNQLTTDTSFDTEVLIEDRKINVNVNSSNSKIPSNINTPGLQEKINLYMVDYIMTGNITDLDKYA